MSHDCDSIVTSHVIIYIYIHVYVVVFRCAPLEDIPVLHLQLLDSLEETLVSHIIYIYRITDRVVV